MFTKSICGRFVDKWDDKFPTIQVTVADSGDAKTMFRFNRRLNDPQWKLSAASEGAQQLISLVV